MRTAVASLCVKRTPIHPLRPRLLFLAGLRGEQ
jgi:hypothetical protein